MQKVSESAKKVVEDFFDYRQKTGLSLRQAAKLLGVSHVYLCNVENGREKASQGILGKMAKMLEKGWESG